MHSLSKENVLIIDKYGRFGYIYLLFPGREITLISPNPSTQVFSLESHCKAAAPCALILAIYALRLLIIPGDSGIRRRIPGWFFCLTGAALLLIPCHILIVRKGWQSRFSPLVFSYLALMFLFATILWFLFFVN
jgi:hypothetical protein